MPAICQCLVQANLYTTVGVVIFNTLNIRACLAAQCLSEDAVCICQVRTGVGVLHVVAPAVHGGGCSASYALHYQGFIVAVVNFAPFYAAGIKFSYTGCFIPLHNTCLAGRSQTFGNSYLPLQVSAICCMIGILNLFCQYSHGCFNFSLTVNIDIIAVGEQNYTRAFFSITDNSIAGFEFLCFAAFIIVIIDNGFPTAVMINLKLASSASHIQITGFTLSCTTIYCQADSRSCTSCHLQQGHACSFILVISQYPCCAVLDVHYNTAVIINIITAGQLGVLFIQADFNAAAIACIYITINSTGCVAAVYSNIAAVGIDAAVDSQCAVVAVNIYVSVFTCVDCRIGAADNSAAVQGYVAVFSINAYIAADAGVTINSNVCTICIDAGFTLQLQLSLSAVDVDVVLGCIYCSAAFNLNLSRILSEYIGSVFLQNAILLIVVISLGITGNSVVELAAFRSLGFRIGDARSNRAIL